jgi:beta-phosphoglucomutase-like phosphatase (HAD superfamily)/CMP-N-acetylneuraminic acid synthetase
VQLLTRNPTLDSNKTTANELFLPAINDIDADIIVLCHATAPHISAKSIQDAINILIQAKTNPDPFNEPYDSVFSALPIKTYCWYDNKPLNHDHENTAPTQDLAPVLAETSGFHIFYREDYLKTHRRVGNNPYPFPLSTKEAIDIDYPHEFEAAAAQFLPQQPLHPTNPGPHPLRALDHISFDMDGVLIDSIPVMEIAWAKAAEHFDLNQSFSHYKAHIGRPFNDILTLIGVPEHLHASVHEVYNATAIANADKIVLYPQILTLLHSCRQLGLKISLVTSKNRQRTELILKQFELQHAFDTIITPEDTTKGKPHPDPLNLASARVGADPQNSLYVGDMETDKRAANNAG